MDWATVFVETFSCMASRRRGCDLKAKLGGVFSDDTFVVGGFSVCHASTLGADQFPCPLRSEVEGLHQVARPERNEPSGCDRPQEDQVDPGAFEIGVALDQAHFAEAGLGEIESSW
jgi:hypothetical protein